MELQLIVLAAVLVASILAPLVAALSILVTKHPRTRWFWGFLVLYALASTAWILHLVSAPRIFERLFGLSVGAP